MRIADGVEMFELSANLIEGPGIIHPTLIWDKEEVLLVDTGFPGQLPKFREAFEQAGVAFERLSKIIITHHDMDHLGGLSDLLKEAPSKVEVLAHAEEKPYIQGEQPPIKMAQLGARLGSIPEEKRQQLTDLYEGLKRGYDKLKVKVDKTLSDGEELPYCGGITVIHTPGHTPGHICLYLRQSKTLVTGDAMNVYEGSLMRGPDFTAFDKELAAESLKKLTAYDIENVICYHGGLYRRNANQRIRELANA